MPKDANLTSYIKKRLEGLKQARYGFEGHWQQIINYLMPTRQGITTRYAPGSKRMGLIYDSTGPHAHALLAAALHGLLTNPANPWFSMKPEGDDLNGSEEVAIWQQAAESVMYSIFNGSNWNTEVHEAYFDISGLGTAVMFQFEDREKVAYFDNRSLGECYLAENFMGHTDTIFRVYPLTARQMEQEWGKKALSKRVLEKLDNDPQYQFEIIHAIYPRTDRDPYSRTRRNMPIASIYIEADSDWVIDEGGFHEFPACSPRWSRMAGEIYGRSPGMVALPDIKMLNLIKETYIRAAQKQLDPPLVVPNDGFINPIRTHPGAINHSKTNTATDRVQAFPVSQNIRVGDEMIIQVQQSIRQMFYNDMLQMPNGQEMTATEVIQRVEEKLRILGPVMGRLQDDLLAPTIQRTFAIAMRRRLIPPPPEILAGRTLKIEYVSPLAKAQRLAQAQGIARALEFLLPLYQIKPEGADNIDVDVTTRYIYDVYSAPKVALVPKKKVEMVRQARAQQEAQMQQTGTALAATEALPRMAKGAEENSPMQAFLSALGGDQGTAGGADNPPSSDLAAQGVPVEQ